MHFRTARLSDAPALLEIYREYIDTPITFEYALPSEDEFKDRIRSISEFFPYLVLEDDSGVIVGYAYAHRHMERAAYQWNAELSIYLSLSRLPEKAGGGALTGFFSNFSRFRA